MELLERYLLAVKKHLPKQGQEDILAELRANLESQIEEREAEMGRPADAAEQEAWLKQIGSPMQMAARFQPQQYLIGPAVFPYFRFVLMKAMAICALVYALVNAVLLSLNTLSLDGVIAAVLRFPGVAMITASWVTLAFAALEFARIRFPAQTPCLDQWMVSELPALESKEHGNPRGFASAVANVLVGVGFLVYLLLIPRHPYLLLGPGAVYLRTLPYKLAPAWTTFYWGVVALNVLQVSWRTLSLAQGKWKERWRLEELLSKAVAFGLLMFLLNTRDHAYIVLKNPADQAALGSTLYAINRNVHLPLSLVVAIGMVALGREVWLTCKAAYDKRKLG